MNKEKGGFFELRKNTYFWLVFVVVTLAIYFVQVGSFVDYKSQISILVLPKNERIATNIELVKNNLEYLFKDEYKKKGIESGEIKIVSKKDNTIITFEISSNDQEKLRNADREVVQDFFDIASKYYSIKNDLEMSLVGDVVVESQPKSFGLALAVSAALGFLISFIVFWLTDILDGIFSKLSRVDVSQRVLSVQDLEMKNKILDSEVVKQDNDETPSIREELEIESIKKDREEGLNAIERLYSEYDQNHSFDLTQTQESIEGEILETEDKRFGAKEEVLEENEVEKKEASNDASLGTSKGAAPSNLPISDNVVIIGGDAEENKESTPQESKSAEPTNEEYKKRLNQLLKGEM